MTNKTEIDELWTAYTEAAKSSGMEGDLDIYNIEDMNDAAHALYTALATLLAERDAAVAEADRLRTNRDRFPELMAQVMAEKNLPLPDRIERLKDAIADLAPNIAKYQWVADEKPAFGEKYIRHVVGDDGEGMGRQWLASCPPHIKGLAEYIAAANPDTVSMLLAELTSVSAALPAEAGEEKSINWRDDPDAIVEDDEPQTGRDYA